MDYPQMLSPIINFLHRPTSQAWIDEAREPENPPLLLTGHMVYELRVAQSAILLVHRYATGKADADELLACLRPYEDFTYRQEPEPDFVALYRRINKGAMPQTDDPWDRQLLDSMILLIKEELHHLWQVQEMMLTRDIPYVKITVGSYAHGMRRGVHSYEPVMLIDKSICGVYIKARSCERFAALVPWLDDDLQKFHLLPLRSEVCHYRDYLGLTQKITGDDVSERVRQLGEAGVALILKLEAEFRFCSGVPAAA